MKIHVDKSDAFPRMGLSAAQLRRILALAPAEWLTDVSEVHVSSSLVPDNSRCRPGDASFNPYDRRLTIFARGCTPRQLVTPILSALAAHHLALPHRRGNRLSEADAKRLAHVVAPFAEHVVERAFTNRNITLH
jgi:hypothetical protein